MRDVLRLFQRPVADEIHVIRGVFIHKAALRKKQGKALERLQILRMRIRGKRRRLSVDLPHAGFPCYARINDIVHDGLRRGKTEHTGEYNLDFPLTSCQIFDRDMLCLDRLRHALFLRQDKESADNAQAAFRFIGNDGMILRMAADGGFHIRFHVGGIENLLAVFDKIKLAVAGLAVLLRNEIIARRRDLSCRGAAEGAPSKRIERALWRREKRRRKTDPVADKQVDIEMRADFLRFQIKDMVAVFVKQTGASKEKIVLPPQ